MEFVVSPEVVGLEVEFVVSPEVVGLEVKFVGPGDTVVGPSIDDCGLVGGIALDKPLATSNIINFYLDCFFTMPTLNRLYTRSLCV